MSVLTPDNYWVYLLLSPFNHMIHLSWETVWQNFRENKRTYKKKGIKKHLRWFSRELAVWPNLNRNRERALIRVWGQDAKNYCKITREVIGSCGTLHRKRKQSLQCFTNQACMTGPKHKKRGCVRHFLYPFYMLLGLGFFQILCCKSKKVKHTDYWSTLCHLFPQSVDWWLIYCVLRVWHFPPVR